MGDQVPIYYPGHFLPGSFFGGIFVAVSHGQHLKGRRLTIFSFGRPRIHSLCHVVKSVLCFLPRFLKRQYGKSSERVSGPLPAARTYNRRVGNFYLTAGAVLCASPTARFACQPNILLIQIKSQSSSERLLLAKAVCRPANFYMDFAFLQQNPPG
jgi:hypothetical protein